MRFLKSEPQSSKGNNWFDERFVNLKAVFFAGIVGKGLSRNVALNIG